jgi:hypothetical protein
VTHLGERTTPLVDGRLAPDAVNRAAAHAATCPACRTALAGEQRVRALLRADPGPQPSAELVARLLALGGPAGPLRPRPGHVPGTPRPAPLPPPGRLALGAGPWEPAAPAAGCGPRGRQDGTRPSRARRRSRRARVASVAVGALSLASLGLLGIVALGGWAGGAAVTARLGDLVLATGEGQALDDAALDRLRADGWPCPASLPDGMRLVAARAVSLGRTPAVHLRYSDGRSTVTVVEQRGRLDAGAVPGYSRAVVGGVPLLAQQAGGGTYAQPAGGRWHGVWQSGDLVLAVVSDAPAGVVEDVVAALPHDGPDDGAHSGWWDGLEDRAGVLGSLLAGS